ncbi:MAG: glutamate--tRNA ligase [Rhodothermales bacterium]
MADTVRVRFAPSPTGLLHIGGLRTALYNYLFARKHGGTVLLRIEDTDRSRYVEEAEADILDSLAWAGLDYDEGPEKGGPHAPYYQSKRGDLYERHVAQLVESGHAYYAFDTEAELDAMRERLTTKENPTPKYDAVTRAEMQNSLTLSAEEVQRRLEAGDEYVVRLKVEPGHSVRFEDLIRGWVSFDSSEIDDQVLLKSDGMPTYHLANVVDDHAMDITHVIRGEEWLPSVPKHLLLYEAFNWEPPAMAHLPLILSPTGGKLSKRNADKMGIPVSVKDYRAAGYEPEALVNFLAFLGWNPGDERELFSFDELVDAYSVERTSHSGAQFNLDKLKWYNGQYLRAKSVDALADEVRPFLDERGLTYDDETLHGAAALMQERITFAHEIATDAAYFFEDPTEYEEAGVKKRWKDDSAALVRAYADRLEADDAFTVESTEAVMRQLAEDEGAGFGRIIHPVRLATTGVTGGAGMFETLVVIGREATIRRLRRAADVLG